MYVLDDFFLNLICCLQWCLYICGRTETVAKRTFFLMEIWLCGYIYIYIDLLMDIDLWILIEVAEQKHLFWERFLLLKICFVDMHLYIDLTMAIRVDFQILIDVEERKQLPRELFFVENTLLWILIYSDVLMDKEQRQLLGELFLSVANVNTYYIDFYCREWR